MENIIEWTKDITVGLLVLAFFYLIIMAGPIN